MPEALREACQEPPCPRVASAQMGALTVPLWLAYKPRYATAEVGHARLARPKGSSAPPAWLRKRLDTQTARVGGCDVYAVRARDAGDAPGTGPVVVYLHGGAYCHEIVLQHWRLVAELDARSIDFPLVSAGIYG